MAKVYVADDPQLGRVSYRDRKRAWWLLSVVYPLLPFTGMAAHAASGAADRPGAAAADQLRPDAAARRADRRGREQSARGRGAAARGRPLLPLAHVGHGAAALRGADRLRLVGRHARPVVVGAADPGLRRGHRLGAGHQHRSRARPQAQRRSSSGWRGWCWRSRPTDTSRSNTGAATTAACRRPRTTRVRAWARASTASRCASCRAASGAPGSSSANAWRTRGDRPSAGTTRCCSRMR